MGEMHIKNLRNFFLGNKFMGVANLIDFIRLRRVGMKDIISINMFVVEEVNGINEAEACAAYLFFNLLIEKVTNFSVSFESSDKLDSFLGDFDVLSSPEKRFLDDICREVKFLLDHGEIKIIIDGHRNGSSSLVH